MSAIGILCALRSLIPTVPCLCRLVPGRVYGGRARPNKGGAGRIAPGPVPAGGDAGYAGGKTSTLSWRLRKAEVVVQGSFSRVCGARRADLAAINSGKQLESTGFTTPSLSFQ